MGQTQLKAKQVQRATVVTLADNNERIQASPTQNAWYNLNSSSITLPAGTYDVTISCGHGVQKATADYLDVYTTLSTANNSESNSEYTLRSSNALTVFTIQSVMKRFTLTVASETTYYVNTRTTTSSTNPIYRTNLLVTAIRVYP